MVALWHRLKKPLHSQRRMKQRTRRRRRWLRYCIGFRSSLFAQSSFRRRVCCFSDSELLMLQPKARHAFGPSKVVAGGIPRQQGGRAPAASLRNGANLPVPSCAAEDMSFPFGPGRICHPFNFNRFDIRHESCEGLYAQRAILHPGWWLQLGVLSKLAAEVQNCSSVQSCGLGKLFLFHGCLNIAWIRSESNC